MMEIGTMARITKSTAKPEAEVVEEKPYATKALSVEPGADGESVVVTIPLGPGGISRPDKDGRRKSYVFAAGRERTELLVPAPEEGVGSVKLTVGFTVTAYRARGYSEGEGNNGRRGGRGTSKRISILG